LRPFLSQQGDLPISFLCFDEEGREKFWRGEKIEKERGWS